MLNNIFQPYHTMQEMNLDWILTKVKNILRFVPDDGSVGQILRRTAHGAEWSNEQGGGGAVDSVNGQTGTVVLGKSDIGLGNVDNVQQYSATNPPPYPVTSVNGQTGDVIVSGGGAVDSVNGQTGTVVLGKSDIGLGNVDNVQQYSATNPPPYPVTSVNGQTGAVTLSIPDSTSDLVNDSGFVDAAGAMSAALPTVIVDDTYSTASSATFDKTYTVSGNGVIAVFASILSDTTEDYGTWQARIYHNGTCIMGEGTRFTTAYNQAFGASTSAPIQVSNGDTIRVYLYITKGGRKDGYRRFLCFGGCSVS